MLNRIHFQKINAHTQIPKPTSLMDTHIVSQPLELNFCDYSHPCPTIPSIKERRHNSWPQSVKYIDGCKGTTWRHFRSAEMAGCICTCSVFWNHVIKFSNTSLFSTSFVLFISTVYYSTASPRVNKYNGYLQSNYRLQMFNKVNYFTSRSTFELIARCFSFALFTAVVGVGVMVVGTFPIYSLFTCLVTNSLRKAIKHNSLFKKLNCN